MIEKITAFIRQRIKNYHPDTAIILGSGLGSVADTINNPIILPYADIPGFPQTTVAGHKGQLIIGQLNNHQVLCMQGRFHLYEGHNPQVINTIIQVFKSLGIKQLIITNAAGSLNPDIPPGSIMMITDHINFSGHNPLIGKDNEKYGPRFPSLVNAYPTDLQQKIQKIANDMHIKLHKGIYMMVLGPNFETAAEIKAFRILGADAVGMSTVPEVICAARCNIKVLGLSVITNYGTGMSQSTTSHQETLEQGQRACADLTKLITAYLKE